MSSQSFDYVALAHQYCNDVLAGIVLAPRQVHQACKRHLDDIAKSETDPNYEYTFDHEKANRVCRFVTKLPHVKGRWASAKDNRFKLEPWQAFFLCSLFGWNEKETGFRRFREALLLTPRKQGKSFLASAVLLYCFLCDNEPGAEIYAAANSFDQSMTVFRPAKMMVERLTALQERFDIEVKKESLTTPDGSSFVPLIGIARDGGSVHCAVIDEYHEADDDSLYQSLIQSTGSRTQSLILVTSTAGVSIEGPCYRLQKECEEVLGGMHDRPELFALIYGIDKETDWTTEDALRMANPNFGVSVDAKALRREQQNAIKQASKQTYFKTKKLNVWCAAASAFFNMQHWHETTDRKLNPEDFVGERCWMAADLSSHLDLTVVTKLFQVGNKFYVFPRFYLPEERANDPTLGMYTQWTDEGYLTATSGNTIDIELVLDETGEDILKYKPVEFAFDDWQADFFTQVVQKRFPKLTLVNVAMNVRTLSPAMFEVEAQLASKRLWHPENPIATWNIANTMAKPDKNHNVFPFNPDDAKKYDFTSTLLMVVSRAMVRGTKSTSAILFA